MWNGPLCILRGCLSNFLSNCVFLLLKIAFILSNSADHNKIPHYAAFHLGVHCVPKYIFTGIQNEKGDKIQTTNYGIASNYEILILMAYVNSKSSDETVHLPSVLHIDTLSKKEAGVTYFTSVLRIIHWIHVAAYAHLSICTYNNKTQMR